jgi:hypothetical protein
LTATRGLSGLPLTAAAPFCLPTTRCQTQVTNAQLVHHEGLAVDVTTLSKDELRMAQLSGLFGVSLTTVTGNRALVPVRTMPRAAPFQHLSFWALRQGTRRELHVNLTNRHLFGRGPRVVASRVDGAPWACLPIAARPGVAYSLFKLRFNIASLHRQWGRTGAVAWIVGLCNFYRDQNRGLRPGVGDISHIVGEEMADDHRGHREGRDVDLYVLEYPPNALPRAFFCDGAGNVSAFTTPPDPSGVYGPPLLALATVDANLILQKYATFLAYCLATWSNVQVVIWKCANSVRNLARDLALAAFDGGWRASWGPAPSSRQDILTAHRQFNTKVIGDDAHRDHMHVKLVATI